MSTSAGSPARRLRAMRTDMMEMLLCITVSMEGRAFGSSSGSSVGGALLRPKRDSRRFDQPLAVVSVCVPGSGR